MSLPTEIGRCIAINTELIIESILTLIAYIITISALIAVPAAIALVLYFVLPKKRRVRRRIAACVFTFLSVAVFITAAVLNKYPPIIVPDELAGYITDEDINTARGLGAGFYGRGVPFFSLYIEFDYADEIEREITAHYFFGLTRRYAFGSDAPSEIY